MAKFLLFCLLSSLVHAHDPGSLDYPFDSGNRGVHNEVCWERCFQVEDTEAERFREIYDDIYRMGKIFIFFNMFTRDCWLKNDINLYTIILD